MLISNCPLCEEHSLNVVGEEEEKVMQCLNCGYVSNPQYLGSKETNEAYKKLNPDLQSWIKETEGRLWLPVQFQLPVGMLYPVKVDEEMKWAFVEATDVLEDEKENFKNPDGGYYDKKYDVENIKIYDDFLDGMVFIKKQMQQEIDEKETSEKITLPKLKKLDGGE